MLNVDVEADRRDFTVRAAFDVADGERVALFGPSGAGKTTVLEVIAGLVEPRSCRIELGGRTLTSTGSPGVAVPPWERRVGLLRQDPGLFPHLSVRANLTYARSARPRRAGVRPGVELTEIASSLGIEGLLAAMPARLSGGQRHRVALGRLLLAHCDALLLDEPFASLDAALRRSLTALVKDLSSRAVRAVGPRHPSALGRAGVRRPAPGDGRGRDLAGGSARPGGAPPRLPARRRARGLPRLRPRPARPGAAWPACTRTACSRARIRPAGSSSPEPSPRPDRAGPAGRRTCSSATPRSPAGCRPAWTGPRWSVTLLDPPYFGPDGALRGDAIRPSDPARASRPR